MSYFTAEKDVNVDGIAQNQTIWSLNSKRFLIKKTKLWIPAQNFEFQRKTLKTRLELNEWAMSFPVTKVFCFLKVWKKEQRNFKYEGESNRVKNIRPDYLCITLNLIDDWLKQVRQTRNGVIQIIAIFVDWIL